MIELTQKLLKEVLDYNSSNGEFTWKMRRVEMFQHCVIPQRTCAAWNKKNAGNPAGWVEYVDAPLIGYIRVKVFGKIYKAHRLAFLYMEGSFPECDVDHIDGIGLNNAWVNLRPASMLENAQNHSKQKNNISGVVGVGWHKGMDKWVAYICGRNRRKHIGYFDLFEDAVLASRKAETSLGYHENHGRQVASC